MIEILGWLIRKIATDDAVKPYVKFAFELARWCAGWQLKKVIDICKRLGFIAEFDGCASGLQGLRGWPSSWRCDGTHHHGVN
eukprot:6953449-Heterocapsa_arctica.AAC.1